MDGNNEKNIEVFMVSAQDKDEVFRLLKDAYVTREPLCIGLHMNYDELSSLLEHTVPPTLESHVSFGMRERVTGELVAIMLNRIIFSPEEEEALWVGTYQEEKINSYINILHNLCAGVDILKSGGFRQQLELQLLCVHPNYKKQGLARKLIMLSEEKAREVGCDVATLQAVNSVSDHICRTSGYREVRRIDAREVLTEGKKKLFDEGAMERANANGTTCLTYLLKEL